MGLKIALPGRRNVRRTWAKYGAKHFHPYFIDKDGEFLTLSTKQNWWDAVRMPSADSHLTPNWAVLSFSLQALAGAPPSRKRWATASLREGTDIGTWIGDFSKKFEDLRLIEENLAVVKDDTSVWYFSTGDTFVRIEFDGDSKIEFGVYGNNAETLKATLAWFHENTTDIIPSGRVHVLITTSEGPDFKSMGIGGEDLIRDNYSDEALRGFDRVVSDLTAKNPAGRVAIFSGKPGTGKTFMVRGLLNAIKDAIMIIVPANLVAQLAQPGMIPALVELHKERGEKPMIFIIEDADEVLATRMGDNMSAVSAILNLGDGILGKLLDIRIIATTNASRADLDEAILRPGRLSATVDVGPLSQEKAQAVFERLAPGKEPLKGKFTLAQIYQQARDAGWVPAPAKAPVGFQVATPEEES